MPKLPGNMTYPRRGAALRGVGYVRQGRNQQVFSSWPKPRGKAKTALQAQTESDFAAACIIVKNMDPLFQDFARQVAKETPLLPRDLLFRQLYRRPYWFYMPDGRKVFPVAAMQDVSLLLDAVWQLENGLLVRGPTWWQGLPPGAPKSVLTVQSDESLGWSAGASGIGGAWWLGPDRVFPSDSGSGIDGGYFAAYPFSPTADISLTAVNVIAATVASGMKAAGAIYEADLTTRAFNGGALLAAGALQNLALGLNTLPLPTSAVLQKGHWYWGGIWLSGSGTNNFAALAYNAYWAYMPASGSSLPGIVSGSGYEQNNAPTWWFSE